jgi:hypothetical protein
VLAPRLPDAERDLHALTDAFVEARYSRHPFDASRLGSIRACWQTVRSALRHVHTSRAR